MPTLRESILRQEAEGITDINQIVITAAEESGAKIESATRTYQEIHRKTVPGGEKLLPKKPKGIRTVKLKELVDKERLDVGAILQAALDNLKPGECVYDDVFPRDLGISLELWRRDVRNREEFLQYQVQLPNRKRVWCSLATREELFELDGVREVIV